MPITNDVIAEILYLALAWDDGKHATRIHIAQRELAQLRADVDEWQRIRELIEPLDGQSVYDAVDALLHDESSAEIYKVEIAEQARQLDEARNIIATVSLEAFGTNGSEYLRMKKYVRDKCDTWLAANPAPQVERP